jgi:Flp pilus assembly protein TadD
MSAPSSGFRSSDPQHSANYAQYQRRAASSDYPYGWTDRGRAHVSYSPYSQHRSVYASPYGAPAYCSPFAYYPSWYSYDPWWYGTGTTLSVGISYGINLGHGWTLGLGLNHTWGTHYYSRSYYRCDSVVYSCYRPYYLCAPSWYGWSYDPWLGYTRPAVQSIDDRDYSDGYREGYRDASVDTGSPYRSDRKRTKIDDVSDSSSQAPAPVTPVATVVPADYDACMNRGAKAFSDGDFMAAVAAYRDASIASPTDGEAKLALGHAAFAAQRWRLAEFAVSRAITLDADSLPAERGGGVAALYGSAAAFNLKLAALERAVSDDRTVSLANGQPRDAGLLTLYGYMQLFAGRVEGAAGALDDALSIDPNDAAAKALYAETLRRLGS